MLQQGRQQKTFLQRFFSFTHAKLPSHNFLFLRLFYLQHPIVDKRGQNTSLFFHRIRSRLFLSKHKRLFDDSDLDKIVKGLIREGVLKIKVVKINGTKI